MEYDETLQLFINCFLLVDILLEAVRGRKKEVHKGVCDSAIRPDWVDATVQFERSIVLQY